MGAIVYKSHWQPIGNFVRLYYKIPNNIFMKKLTTFLICITTALFTYSQSVGTEWLLSLEGGEYNGINDFTIDSKGDVIVVGAIEPTANLLPRGKVTTLGEKTTHVAKFSSDGELIWAKSFSIGSQNNTRCWSLVVDGDDNILVSGFYSGEIDLDPGSGVQRIFSDPMYGGTYLVKLTSNGEYIRHHRLGVSGPVDGTSINEMVLHPNGNIIMAGSFGGGFLYNNRATYSSTTYSNGFIIMIDSLGDEVWFRHFESLNYVSCNRVTTSSNGDIHFRVGFRDSLYVPHATFSDTLISTSVPNRFGQKGSSAIFSVDEFGNYLSNKVFHTTTHYLSDIVVDSRSNLYVSGSFQDSLDADPGPGVHYLYSKGKYDGFLLKFNQAGDFVQARSIGDSLSNSFSDMFFVEDSTLAIVSQRESTGNTILTLWDDSLSVKGERIIFEKSPTSSVRKLKVIMDNDNMYTLGKTEGEISFNPSYFPFSITGKNSFVQKISPSPYTSISPVTHYAISLFPNPTRGTFSVDLGENNNIKIEILDSQGRRTFQQDYLSVEKTQLKLEGSPGLYLVNISNAKGLIYSQKLLKLGE